jgi:hypothetical protein
MQPSLTEADLGTALSTARVKVSVVDIPGPAGKFVNGALVNILDMPDNVQCDPCGGTTHDNQPLTFTLTGVSSTEVEKITVEASGVPGFEAVIATVSFVAFSTVDLEIVLTSAFPLLVQRAGNGTGAVTSSPVGIDCSSTGGSELCKTDFSRNTQVTLTATPSVGATFAGWSGGGCSGTGLCIVTMDQTYTVTATFTLGCNYSIFPTSWQFTSSGGAGSIDVIASGGCSWNATESVDWITITSGSSGSGIGTVNYLVLNNTGASSRTATITAAGISHTVNQAPPPIAAIDVDIDIRPWSKRNPISYKGRGILPVAILSTGGFNAPSEVDQTSLTFGATGNEESLAFCNRRPKDFSKDGSKDDLLCHFYIEKAGFKCGDTEGILNGKTVSGIPIEGEDLVRIIQCK